MLEKKNFSLASARNHYHTFLHVTHAKNTEDLELKSKQFLKHIKYYFLRGQDQGLLGEVVGEKGGPEGEAFHIDALRWHHQTAQKTEREAFATLRKLRVSCFAEKGRLATV